MRGVAPYNKKVNSPTAWTNADLHCYSRVSDGTLEPEALAEYNGRQRLQMIVEAAQAADDRPTAPR